MINCGPCGAELVKGNGVFTSSVFGTEEFLARGGLRSTIITCGCGAGTYLSAGSPVPSENTQEPKQVEETIQGQLAGVREFMVTDDGDLGGLVYGGIWKPDKPWRATCAKSDPGRPFSLPRLSEDYYSRGFHDVPAFDCQCGFYSFGSLEEADRAGDGFSFPHRVRAVVSAWGNVVICEHGFRAEWMQIEAIIKQPTFAWGAEIDASAAWARIAARYSVPVVDEKDVPEFCESLGTVVDGDAERHRATEQQRHEQAERLQKATQSLNGLGKKLSKVMEETEEKRNKPAFWCDRLPNKKKGWDFGV